MASEALTLTPQRQRILDLYREGHTGRQIARLLNISESRVSQHLKKAKLDTRVEAGVRLQQDAELIAQQAVEAVKVAATKGDATAALELLDRLDVAPSKRRPAAPDAGPRVVVVVGNPTPNPAILPALPYDPPAEASPLLPAHGAAPSAGGGDGL